MNEHVSEGGIASADPAKATDARFDPLPYMLNNTGRAMQDTRPGRGEMQRTVHNPAENVFWYLKHPASGLQWEEYHYDEGFIWLSRDTTAPPDEGPGSAYDVVPPDGMWFPRFWRLGEESRFNVDILYFNHTQSPCPDIELRPWRHGRHRLRYVGRVNLAGDLGEQDVLVYDRYHDVTLDSSPPPAERFWLARGFGWVRFDSWENRLLDPRFDSGNLDDLLHVSPTKQVIMNSVTDAGKPFEPVRCRKALVPKPITIMRSPQAWAAETAWPQGFDFFGSSSFSFAGAQGSGKFVYDFQLPYYPVGSSEATVTAALASGSSGAASDVTLSVNGTPCGTQRVPGAEAGSAGTEFQWTFPEGLLDRDTVNKITFSVRADAPLRNGLSIFGGVASQPSARQIRLSIPAESTRPVEPVQETYDAAFLEQQVPSVMLAGVTYPVSIKMYNLNSRVWRADRVWLRSEQPADNTTWNVNRVSLPGAVDLPGHSDAKFDFTVQAPQQLGPTLFRWGMAAADHGPFGQRNAPVWVTVAKDALFLGQTVPSTMVGGTTLEATVTFRNIGTVPWTPGTGFRLGSQGPADNMTWGRHRVELLHEVPRNGDVTFKFPITAPRTEGRYVFQWQVLQEGVRWLGQASPAFEVRVMPPLITEANKVSVIVRNPIPPGAVQMVAVTMKNVGTDTWTAVGGYMLGSQNPIDNVRWGTNRVPVPHDVPPNTQVTFTFGITARDAVGTWNFQWQMLREGIGWFGQMTDNVEVHIAPTQQPLRDLHFLKNRNVPQAKVEAHTATNATNYGQGSSLVTRFASADTDNGWFGMHRNGDIYFVKARNTASGKVEVFTASRSSAYTEGIAAVTRFSVNDQPNGRFGMLPNGDLYFVKLRNTGTGKVELFTALSPTYATGLSIGTRFAVAEGANGWFGVLPNNDLYFIKTRNTVSGAVEALTATSASWYASGIQLPTRFAVGEADNGTFGMLPYGDVYFVKTRNTAARVEVFTATRSSNYASGLARATRFSLAEGMNGSWGMM